MKISHDGRTVYFKTEPKELFEEEKSGVKSNTVRILDIEEYHQLRKGDPKKIIIQYQQEVFLRTITNIHATEGRFRKVIVVISWTKEQSPTSSADHHSVPIEPGPHNIPIENGARGGLCMTEDYLGCDPGLNGSFAVVSGDTIRCKMVMPTLSFTTKEGKTKTEIDREGVLSFLKLFPPHMHVVIEKQEAYRSQNITATCTTCKNYGVLLMALTVARCYIAEEPASVWQKHFGIVPVKKGAGRTTKEQGFDIAQTLYPGVDFRKTSRSHKFHDGITDATLLANYCQFLFKEEYNEERRI